MEKKRYLILGIVIICQAGLFLVLKLYFFEKLNIQQKGLIIPTVVDNSTIANNTVIPTANTTVNTNTNTSSTNSTLLMF